MSPKNPLEEALSYFNSRPILRSMLQKFAQKYRSLGRAGGTVRLQLLSPEERESLGGLLGKDLSRQKTVTVSTVQLEQALRQTRFAGLSLQELLFAFIGGPIPTKAEIKELREAERRQYFSELAQNCGSRAGRDWLEHIIKKGSGSRGINRAYRKDKVELRCNLTAVLSALQQLPAAGYERLPVFAARVTGDPHGFDPAEEQGRLLIEALQFLRTVEGVPAPRPSASEDVSELLAASGLLREDILNFVTCTGLLAFRAKNRKLLTWEKAHAEGIALNVPLREVAKIEVIVPAVRGGAAIGAHSVYAVENPGVFSEILDAFEDRPYPPLICTHGQFGLATLLLLDKLTRGNARIFYSGDFDPEGLQITQRLLQRYPHSAVAWRYGKGDYANTNPSQPLVPARLKKLNQISHPALVAAKESIYRSGRAGYQEQIIPYLIEDLKAGFSPPDGHFHGRAQG